MVKKRAPDRGDVVWLNFTPQSGHEQAGKRPALVLSPRSYNEKVGLAIFCPVTSQVKGYPFEVPLNGKIKGAVLSDQIRSLDWVARSSEYIEKAAPGVVAEVLSRVQTLLQ